MKEKLEKKSNCGGDGGGGGETNENLSIKALISKGLTPGEAAVAWLAKAPSEVDKIIPKDSKAKK